LSTPLTLKRRELLIGAGLAGAFAAAGSGTAVAQMGAPMTGVAPMPPMSEIMAKGYDPAYVEHVIMPFLRTSFYQAETPSLPMIGEAFSKQYALPYDLWGLLYDDWAPSFEKDGLSVFILGLDERGPHNRRKRIYISALTADLYPMYAGKVRAFFDRLLDENNAGKPLMQRYLDSYFDLFWDLHLGVTGDEIPDHVRQIGQSFNAVLGFRDPSLQVVHDNYMKVRALRTPLKQWIGEKTADVMSGRTKDPEKTFVYYWTRNGGKSEDFRQKDIVFESFHNFAALSQWGNTIYNIMMKLDRNVGDAAAKSWFKKTMEGAPDKTGAGPFTPLQRLVMELFRTISPNPGSISSLHELQPVHGADRHVYAITPHLPASFDPSQWADPAEFNPDRYLHAPASDGNGQERAEAAGLARCPFEKTSFGVSDGRRAEIVNSAFGAVYGVVDGKALPVCDHAGYAPFGFGYRRCPGEQLSIEVFSDFLRKVWRDKIEFEQLATANPAKVPIGPVTVIDDAIGFRRSA
jgi:cytochrome P450